MSYFRGCFLACITALALIGTQAQAQQRADATLRDQVNSGVVRIITGPIGSTTLKTMAELANTLRGVDGLRIIPIMGKGTQNNVRDLLFLEHTDLAVVQLDALEALKADRTFPGIERRVSYVTKLFNEEVHLIARSDIADISALAGKRVGMGLQGSGSAITGRTIFETLGIPVEAVLLDDLNGLEQLKRGQLDAVVFIEGKPSGIVGKIPTDANLKLLSIPIDPRLLDKYLPARLGSEDYPNLIGQGASVDTIAVGTALIAFNWRRDTSAYAFLSKFTQAFFDSLNNLHQAPHHPKWQEVNLTAQLPGWRRFGGAEDALNVVVPEACSEPVLQAAFRKFIRAYNQNNPASAQPTASNEQLFQDFLEWLRTNRG